jgi:hypothetical protein
MHWYANGLIDKKPRRPAAAAVPKGRRDGSIPICSSVHDGLQLLSEGE